MYRNCVESMRTTLMLDGESFAVAQNYAQVRALKLGQAVSKRIRLGSAERLPMRQKNGAWIFELPANTPKVTSGQVKARLDDAP